MNIEHMQTLRRRMNRDTRTIANLKEQLKTLQKENAQLRLALQAIAEAPIGLGACNGHATASAALRCHGAGSVE